jgi:hypothetical protein
MLDLSSQTIASRHPKVAVLEPGAAVEEME